MNYLEASAWEARHQSAGVSPPLHDYLLRRRDTSGSAAHHAMTEYAAGMTFTPPPALFTAVRFVHAAASDIAGWHNDLCSLERESARGDHCNLVPVLSRHLYCDRTAAVTTAHRALARKQQAFDGVTSFLLTQTDPVVRRHAGHLAAWVAGTRSWNETAARYRTVSTPEISR